MKPLSKVETGRDYLFNKQRRGEDEERKDQKQTTGEKDKRE
jgi:hypothetical protein